MQKAFKKIILLISAIILVFMFNTAVIAINDVNLSPGIIYETKDTINYRDFRGNEVLLNKNPKRALFLFNSALDLWYMAGGEAVGCINADLNLPAEAEGIKVVGNMSNPNLEKIIALEPDFVVLFPIMPKQREIKKILDQAGITNIYINYQNYNQFLNVLDLFNRLNGNKSSYHDKLKNIKKEVSNIIENCPDRNNPRVLILYSSAKGMLAELPGSPVGSMVQMLNGENIIDDTKIKGADRVKYSLEKIYQKDPDIILALNSGYSEEDDSYLKNKLSNDDLWRELRAVKEGNVYVLPQKYFLFKPNAEYPEAFLYLAQILYPGEFE